MRFQYSKKRWLAAIFLAAISCQSDSLDPVGGSVASVVITPRTATVAVGSSAPLTADVLDGAGRELHDRRVVWATRDAAIASVSSDGVVTGIAIGTVQIAASAEGKNAIAEITVNPTPVASVRLTPTSRSLLVGQTVQLSAEPLDPGGAVLTGRPVTFTTSSATVATVSAAGLVTALAQGSTIITATSEGRNAVATITVASVPVASVAVTPGENPLVVGQTTQLTADPRDAAGQVLTNRTVLWSTDASNIASVSSSGLITAIAPGSATISATSEGKTGTATVTVSPKPVSAIIVSPGQSNVTVGQTAQLSAQVTDDQGNVLGGRPITYTTGSPGIATVSQAGVVTGVAPGTATITATSEGKTGTATVTVTPIPVTSVVVAPGEPNVFVGQSTPLSAVARGPNGQELSGRAVFWASGSASVASISPAGVVVGLTPGSAVIFASIEGVVGTATVTVRSVPVSTVTVTPPTSNVTVGGFVQLAASVKDAAGTELSDRLVGWTSSDETIAVVSSTGRVNGLKSGSVTITASSEGKSGTAAVTVAPIPVASVTVTPPTASLTPGQTTTLTAQALDAGGAVLAGRVVAWSTSNGGVATVTQAGLVTAVATGNATITATSEGKAGTAAITVGVVPVASVAVTPPAASVTVGQTTPLAAQTLDAAGAALTGRAIAWTTSNANIATVTQAGVVTGVAVGNATITATSEGKSGTSAITVGAAPVATVTVAPPTLSLAPGQTGALTATTRDAANNVLTGRAVAWTTSNAAVATVAPNGTVTAVTAGNATITATSEGKTGTSAITVTAVPVATVTVAPPTLSIQAGLTGTLTATTRDAANNVLTGRAVTWTTSNANVATVAPNGTVTAVAAGNATITATSEGKTGTSAITVTAVPVATVTVAPTTASLTVGGTQQIVATPRDAQGAALTGRTITWATGNAGIATVTQAGLITATGVGSTTVTATSEGKVGTVTVTVAAPAVGTVTVTPTAATLSVAGSTTLTATVRDANGAVIPASVVPVVWSTDKPLNAVVTQTGVVTGLLPGTATITATAGGKTATTAITVQLAPVATITVAPATLNLRDRDNQRNGQLTATTRDVLGNVLTGRVVTWTSANPAIATVTQTGAVTAQARGNTTVTAASEGKTATATINVQN